MLNVLPYINSVPTLSKTHTQYHGNTINYYTIMVTLEPASYNSSSITLCQVCNFCSFVHSVFGFS